MSSSPGLGNSVQTNAPARWRGVTALKPQTIAAAGDNGNVKTGETIDRVDPNVALSAQFTTAIVYTGVSGRTLTVRRRVEHMEDEADGGAGTWAEPSTDVFTQPDDEVIDAAHDDAAVVTQLTLDADLSGFRSNVRIKVTGTLSATGVDTALAATTCTLAGFDTAPPA